MNSVHSSEPPKSSCSLPKNLPYIFSFNQKDPTASLYLHKSCLVFPGISSDSLTILYFSEFPLCLQKENHTLNWMFTCHMVVFFTMEVVNWFLRTTDKRDTRIFNCFVLQASKVLKKIIPKSLPMGNATQEFWLLIPPHSVGNPLALSKPLCSIGIVPGMGDSVNRKNPETRPCPQQAFCGGRETAH